VCKPPRKQLCICFEIRNRTFVFFYFLLTLYTADHCDHSQGHITNAFLKNLKKLSSEAKKKKTFVYW